MALSDLEWQSWLESPDADPVVLIETGYVLGLDVVPLYMSDKGYVDLSNPAAPIYPPIVLGDVDIDEASDGVYIADVEAFVEDEIWAARFPGQRFVVLYGDRAWPRADFRQMAACKIRAVLRSTPRVYRFQLDMVGAGALDQILQLPGVPYIMGSVTNIAPPRQGLYTYYWYASSERTLGYVAHKGVTQSYEPGGGATGYYRSWTSGENRQHIITNFTPSGVVTVRTSSSVSLSQALAEMNGMIDYPVTVAASVSAYDGFQFGHYLTDQEMASDVVSLFVESIGGNIRINNREELEIFRFQAPGAATRTLTDADLLADSLEHVAQDPIFTRVEIAFQRIWHVMRQEDWDASANLDRSQLNREWRMASGFSGTARDPRTFRVNTALQDISQASDECARRLALKAAPHERFRYPTGRRGFADEVGDTVTIVSADYGLEGGDDFLVIGNKRRLTAGRSELLLWR